MLVCVVSDLLDPHNGCWDEALVQDIFQPEDAAAILSISICEDMDDSPAWHFDPKGNFSVKSAYKVGVRLRDNRTGRDAASSQSMGNGSFSGDYIWKMAAPNKLKMFIWRLAHNSLANRMKIQKVGVELDTKCPVCSRFNEDGGHLFLKCKKVKECWRILGIEEARESLLHCSSVHAMLETLWKLDEKIQMKAMVLIWEWWYARNKVNAGEALRTSEEVCHRVKKLLVDFRNLQVQKTHTEPKVQHTWTRPPDEHVKVNFDGAWDSLSGNGGWGFIIRNNQGDFVAAGAGRSVHLRDPLAAESVACLAAIDGAIAMGANRIIFESNCSNLVHALKGDEYDAQKSELVKEARSLCIANFITYEFAFCHRGCNQAAHELAKLGSISRSPSSYWEEHAPSYVMNIVASDSAVYSV